MLVIGSSYIQIVLHGAIGISAAHENRQDRHEYVSTRGTDLQEFIFGVGRNPPAGCGFDKCLLFLPAAGRFVSIAEDVIDQISQVQNIGEAAAAIDIGRIYFRRERAAAENVIHQIG